MQECGSFQGGIHVVLGVCLMRRMCHVALALKWSSLNASSPSPDCRFIFHRLSRASGAHPSQVGSPMPGLGWGSSPAPPPTRREAGPRAVLSSPGPQPRRVRWLSPGHLRRRWKSNGNRKSIQHQNWNLLPECIGKSGTSRRTAHHTKTLFHSLLLCGWQGLGAPAGCQAWASEVGESSSGHWTTRLARTLPEISISMLRSSSTQWPASSSAGHSMPNN